MLDRGDDECLGAVIADGDGGGVGFGECAFGRCVEDGAGEEGGAADGEEGDLEFFFVGHGVDLVGVAGSGLGEGSDAKK